MWLKDWLEQEGDDPCLELFFEFEPDDSDSDVSIVDPQAEENLREATRQKHIADRESAPHQPDLAGERRSLIDSKPTTKLNRDDASVRRDDLEMSVLPHGP